MKITETTPPPAPVERKFSIEFTENELKLLGMVLGNCDTGDIHDQIRDRDWTAKVFPGIKSDDNFVYHSYDKIKDLFKS
jgi:hypothetical protein